MSGHLDERTILEQSASLRRMVRALVRDDDAADDVVQETWLTAMRRPGTGFEPGAWLRGIARNVLRTVRRTDARRARREAEAVAEVTTPSAADSASKVERLRELLELVSSLREPIQHTVVLRYFDGLMPREIAAQLSIPVATVKARLTTGLHLLREALDERHGGDRSAWHATFAGLVPGAAAAGAAVTVGALIAGGIAMKTAIGVVSAVVVLGLVLWMGWSRPAEHAPGARTPPASGTNEAGQEPTPGKAPGPRIVPAPPAPEESSTSSAPVTGGLRVLVVEKGTATPVPGARVRIWDSAAVNNDPSRRDLWLLDGSSPFRPPSDATEAVADATGVATFSVTPAARRHVIAETARQFGQRLLASDAGSEARVEVEEDLSMTVRVLDSAGSAVGGVPVRLTRVAAGEPPADFAYGTTAADGLFIARNLQTWAFLLQSGHKSQSFMARLGAAFGASVGVLFDGTSLPKEPVTLRLPGSARLTVTVADREGRPFTAPAYVGVKVREVPDEVPVEKSPDGWKRNTLWQPLHGGRATFPFVGLGSKLNVKVHALEREHALGSSDVDGPTEPGQDLQVTVQTGERLPVVIARLVDDTQQPLKNHFVSICPQSKSEGTHWPDEVVSAKSDSEGRVRVPISGVPWRVRSGLLGFKSCESTLPFSRRWLLGVQQVDVATGEDIVAGDVVMRPVPVLVAGTVRDEAGAPVAGAELLVELRKLDGSRRDFPPGLQAQSRRDGTFAFYEPCDPGDLRLFVAAKDSAKLAPISFSKGQTGLSVTLVRASSLEGSVILPDGVLPRELQVVMTGDCVQPKPDGYGPAREIFEVKADGSFVISGLRPGTGALVVAPWSRARETPRVALARIEGVQIAAGVTRDPRVQAIDLRERIRARTVTVVDSDGGAIAGAGISFPPVGLAPGPGEAFRETGVDGRATLVTGTDPVTVTIAKEGWLDRQLVISERTTKVTLDRGITLEVVVRSDAALPVSPENLRIELQRNERRVEEGSADPVERFWDRAYALVDSTGVATIKAPFTGPARLKLAVNREGVAQDGGVLTIEIEPAPERQRIEWRIPPEVLRKR